MYAVGVERENLWEMQFVIKGSKGRASKAMRLECFRLFCYSMMDSARTLAGEASPGSMKYRHGMLMLWDLYNKQSSVAPLVDERNQKARLPSAMVVSKDGTWPEEIRATAVDWSGWEAPDAR